MEKKRTLGITLISVSLLYFPIGRMYVEWINIGRVWQSSLLAESNNWPLIGSLFPKTFLIVFSLIMIVGVFQLKRWGYYMLLVFFGIILVSDLFSIPSLIIYMQRSENPFPLFILEPLGHLIYSIFVLSYFIQDRIARVYLEKSVKQDISENRWSLGLIVFCGAAIYLSAVGFARTISWGFVLNLRSLAFGWSYWIIYFICSLGLLLRKEIARKIFLGLLGYSLFIAVIQSGSVTYILSYFIQNSLLIFFLTRPKLAELFKTEKAGNK